MVDKALEAGLMDNHCEPDEKEKISKKTGEDKLVSAYNVLRIHQFLGKYESDLNVRRSRSKPAGKKKISAQQREEREAAIEHLVARMHPKPPQTDEKQKESPEVKAARKKKAKENKELINHFLENYTEDMHKRRLHIKQVRFSLRVCLSVPCRADLGCAVRSFACSPCSVCLCTYRRGGLQPRRTLRRWRSRGAQARENCKADADWTVAAAAGAAAAGAAPSGRHASLRHDACERINLCICAAQ
jgi:hypothetical protein